MINQNSAAIALAGILFIGVAGPALGGTKSERQEQSALQGTTLTLTQAIAIAEHQTGGKAYDGVSIEHGKPRVVVETNGPNGVQTVIIDAESGQIVAAHSGGVPD